MAKLFRILDVREQCYLFEGDTAGGLRYGERHWNRPIRIYADATDAAAAAAMFTAECHRKFQPRPLPVSATEWHQRELQRFMDGTYTCLPWDGFSVNNMLSPENNCTWALSCRIPEAEFHFPHVSKKAPGNIAFTENDTKGAADVQTTMKPGRYLKRFYTISEDAVKRYANDLLVRYGTVELRFATTEDEFEAVYTNGPSSCMSHKASEFGRNGGYHPVRIYAAGDLALAYLIVKTANDDDDKTDDDFVPRASARALCWPAKKQHGRIYGDVQKLQYMLREQGYEENWDFTGAKLLKKFIPHSKRLLIMPYMDGDQRGASVSGDYLVWDDDGPINCEVSGGYTELRTGGRYDEDNDTDTCEACGNEYPAEDFDNYRVSPATPRFIRICEGCSEHVFRCAYSSTNYYAPDEDVQLGNGHTWHSYYVSRFAFRSAYSESYFPTSERHVMGDGSYWALSERDAYGEPSATGRWWPKGSLERQLSGIMLHPTEVASQIALGDLLTSLNERPSSELTAGAARRRRRPAPAVSATYTEIERRLAAQPRGE